MPIPVPPLGGRWPDSVHSFDSIDKHSLIIRENTGNSHNFGILASPNDAKKPLRTLGFCQKFLTQRDRKSFWKNRIFSMQQGISSRRSREIYFGEGTVHESSAFFGVDGALRKHTVLRIHNRRRRLSLKE